MLGVRQCYLYVNNQRGQHMTAENGTARAEWRTRATISVPEYAEIMGVGRNTAYEAARAGEIDTIKVRGRVLVCVPALVRKLEGR
jgi:excisionase family DNA binding protein